MDNSLFEKAVGLLQSLIATPSFSGEESGTADRLQQWLEESGVKVERYGNNILSRNCYFDQGKPTLLLCSHHDTVKPAKGYTRDPFMPTVEDNKLYGLGSNDAGGALVSLIAAFLHFYHKETLPYNIILAAVAEEEISGPGGISSVLDNIGPVDGAVVGEPTLMQMAVAERGLMVCDALVTGTSGHAARNEGTNAIYRAIDDIAWLRQYKFEKVSDFLGSVSVNTTVIETANKAHNIIPDQCTYTVDIRLNECYTHEEVLGIIRPHIHAMITPRSTRLRSSIIPAGHPLVMAGKKLGMKSYGSPTLSDKALMSYPALKLGPGDSARSHTANEFIFLDEIKNGINQYIALLELLTF